MIGLVGVLCLDLFEGYLSVQLLVVSDENLAQPAARCGRRMRNRLPFRFAGLSG